MRVVRYWRYGGPEVLELAEVPDPVPGAGEVLIDVHATSVVPGDWKMRAGHLQEIFPARFPIVPGRDGSGVIRAVGPGVDAFAPGDAVVFMTDRVTSGSYAECIVRSARELVAKPANVTHAEAAAANHAGMCAWLGMVETARVAPGMRVLVLGGAGAIGSYAAQIARHYGAHVTATARADNVEYLEQLGAHEVVAPERVGMLRDHDVVFDLVGGALHDAAYAALRPGGCMAYLIAAPIRARAEAVRVAVEERSEVLAAVMALVGQGVVRATLERTFALHEAADAHRFLESGAHRRGRVVLQIRAAHADPKISESRVPG